MKSEMKMPQDRDREVKCQTNSRETRLSQVTAPDWLQLMIEIWNLLIEMQRPSEKANPSL